MKKLTVLFVMLCALMAIAQPALADPPPEFDPILDCKLVTNCTAEAIAAVQDIVDGR